MYDKDLIQRVCDLTCSKDDVVRNQTTIKYDVFHPFKKYYSITTIKGAMKKYVSNEWDDRTLAHWACTYCWILLGGCDYDNITEDLNSFERFLRDVITWDLDGLSFFDKEYDEDSIKCIRDTIQLFENYDHIWQTREEWRTAYAMIGPYDEHNGEQWVVIVNDFKREYMIMNTDHLKNGYEDECFKFVTDVEFMTLVERLKNGGYNILSCAEEYYYAEINDL